MNEKRFVYHDTAVEEHVESLENKTMKEKTNRDVKLMEMFLRKEKGDEREVQNIQPTELNKRLADLIPFCKDGEDYKTSSLIYLVTN